MNTNRGGSDSLGGSGSGLSREQLEVYARGELPILLDIRRMATDLIEQHDRVERMTETLRDQSETIVRLTLQLQAYTDTIVLMGAYEWRAVKGTDHVPLPKGESVAVLLDERKALRAFVDRYRQAWGPCPFAGSDNPDCLVCEADRLIGGETR